MNRNTAVTIWRDVCDDTETRLVRAMIDAAKELHEHRREKREKAKEAKR
jgi:hypothetical protein